MKNLALLLFLIPSFCYGQRVHVIDHKKDTVFYKIQAVDKNGIYVSPDYYGYKFKHIKHIIFYDTPSETDFDFIKNSGITYSVGNIDDLKKRKQSNNKLRWASKNSFKIDSLTNTQILAYEFESFKRKRLVGKALQIIGGVLVLAAISGDEINSEMSTAGGVLGVVGFVVDFGAGLPVKSRIRE